MHRCDVCGNRGGHEVTTEERALGVAPWIAHACDACLGRFQRRRLKDEIRDELHDAAAGGQARSPRHGAGKKGWRGR